MIYALDTNIVSYMMADNDTVYRNHDKVVAAGHVCVIPFMVYYEVKRGLLAINATKRLRIFDALCASMEVRGMDTEDIDAAARIYAWRKQHGRPVGDSDILIAAQCITQGYTLVTNNTKDFAGADEAGKLLLEDWTK